MNIEKNIIVSGKRKTAIAKAMTKKGSGKILINRVPYENLDFFKKLTVEEPIEIAKRVLGKIEFDIYVNIKSGGSESRIEAARLAIARAILLFTKSTKI